MEDLTRKDALDGGTAGRRSAASIVGVNVMLFLSLLALVILLPPAVVDGWRGVRSALGIGSEYFF